jgi:aspartate beta-hydroxylase
MAGAYEMSDGDQTQPRAEADGGHGIPHDVTAERIVAFLRKQGAAEHRHAGGRSLLDHLIATSEIVRRWRQPPVLQHAALLHSVYGTDAHHQPLLPLSRRADVRHLAGQQAERLAYLFCVTPRRPLYAGVHRWMRDIPARPAAGQDQASGEPPAERDELDALIVLHMANMAEQARGQEGSPGVWLVRMGQLAELLSDSQAVTPPAFAGGLATFTAEEETLLRTSYRTGCASICDGAERIDRLALAAAIAPVVAEPCLWLAHLCGERGQSAAAAHWARHARRRLVGLGTAWDKRLTFEEWLELAGCLERPSDRPSAPDVSVDDPRALYEAHLADRRLPPATARHRVGPAPGPAAPSRFGRYMEALADTDGRAVRTLYPDLDSRPWYDAARFPVARYLEAHYDEIRDEILRLDPSRFQPESERIGRSGEWDVAFFYERGRRRDDVCRACPVTTRGIEAHATVRTLAGLIYASRMRPGTHIAPHRGPTNLRLRCHLGIAVPAGDCAIRVGDETRRWQAGQCLVFDDHFEHEAWNHTGADRIVLIVDVWHPDLTAAEVHLLKGLQGYADTAARQLARYWSANAAVRAD